MLIEKRQASIESDENMMDLAGLKNCGNMFFGQSKNSHSKSKQFD